MKRVYFIGFILFSAILFFVISCSSTKNNQEKIRKTQLITEKIHSKDIVIEVNSAQPLRGTTVNLSYGYDLKIKNDSAFAYLPYYGVAQSAPYGGEGGIKFTEPMKDFVLKPMKNKIGWDIRFEVRDDFYLYKIYINIFDNGNSYISINPDKKDRISFNGYVVVDD